MIDLNKLGEELRTAHEKDLKQARLQTLTEVKDLVAQEAKHMFDFIQNEYRKGGQAEHSNASLSGINLCLKIIEKLIIQEDTTNQEPND